MDPPPPADPPAAPTPPVPIVLADRHEGVRIALRERLEAAGGAVVVAEAGTVGEALEVTRSHPGAVLVAGLDLPGGPLRPLLGGGRSTIVYSWLPSDEHGQDLRAAAAVVTAPVVDGVIRALRRLAVS